MTNTNLGGVFTKDTDGNIGSGALVSTENVCGIIFDTNGFTTPLGSGDAATIFANGNVVEVNSMKDVKAAGIDETIMGGLVYHHLNNFFTLAGNNQRLFVSFMDSSVDTTFTAIEQMQLAANGIIYQIGLWTTKPFAQQTVEYKEVANPTGNPASQHYYKRSGDNYVEASETEVASNTTYYTASTAFGVIDNGILTKLQNQAEVLGGKIDVINYEGFSPVNILLNAPVASVAEIDITKLPDLSTLDLPKVSVLLGQPSNDDVHTIQEKLGGYAVVGNIGAALACLAVAPAEVSLGWVESFNLAKVMTNAELGFGNLVRASQATDGVYKFTAAAAFTNIKTLGYTSRNNNLHRKGYIFLTDYAGIENGVFFSCDQTLSTGDYRTIGRGRVMHKSRRVVRLALLPYVNSTWELDASTGRLSASDITMIQNLVINALDVNMVEPGTSKPQISGRKCVIDGTQNILANDELHIDYAMVPVGCTSAIYVTEGFTTSVK